MSAKFALPILLVLSACGGTATTSATGRGNDTSGSTAEARLAKATLDQLQARSFRNNREYCGYIVRNADGSLSATPAVPGDFQSCLPAEPAGDVVIQASYHTHGAFEIDTPAEWPSSGDVIGDFEEGIDGYITTPGGRFWYVDGDAQQVSQLCGIGCVTQDPNFQANVFGQLDQSYTLRQLQTLEQY